MSTFQGKRIDWQVGRVMHPGEYSKAPNGIWYGCCPACKYCNLGGHGIAEHEDGTITASPSILIDKGNDEWHGYLERGVWREV